MNMETMIVGLIGISAAVYLLRRGIKTIENKKDCFCSGGDCCGNRCPEEDAILKKKYSKGI